MSVRSRSAGPARLALLTVVALAIAAGAGPASARGPRELTVMTQNVYVGGSLTPVLGATSPVGFLLAVAGLYASVQATDFPARAAAMAAEIDRQRPDVIGLQEVAKWTTSGPGAPAGQDFLAILLDALAARGLSYSVAVAGSNALVTTPLLTCSSPTVGACLITLEDRDVILVNTAAKHVSITGAGSGRYIAQQSVPTAVGIPVSFNRGWVSIDGTVGGRQFRFITTHLEIPDFAAVQVAQAIELLAGPADTTRVVIAAGDFNSAADGSTTASYGLLTAELQDAWTDGKHGVKKHKGDPGFTCCHAPDLSNATSQHDSRIDLVLSSGDAEAVSIAVLGQKPFQAAAPRWAADHAGVIATIKFGK